MDVTPTHLLEAASFDNWLIERIVGAVNDYFWNVASFASDRYKECGGVNGYAVALICSNYPV